MRSMAASRTSCGVTCPRAISSPRPRASYSAYSLKTAMKVDSGSAETRRLCTEGVDRGSAHRWQARQSAERSPGLMDTRVRRRYTPRTSRSVRLQPMVEEPVQRRLAAILAADVVGYSRLMESDESGTFERLRAHRKELFEPEIAKHGGRIFKLMGDGLLAEFGSVVDAVKCAAILQAEMG